MNGLELTPEEAAELDKNFPINQENAEVIPPVEPEETPPTPPVVPEGTSPDDILKALEAMGEQLKEINKPKEIVPELQKENEESWKPKNWDEVAERARKEAEAALEDRQKKAQDAEQEVANQTKQLNETIEKNVLELESKGRIPKISDKTSDTDPGVAARKEMFALASQFNTMEFGPILDMIETAHKGNQYFDYKTFKWTEKTPNPGKNAPIGSSSTTTPPTKGGPEYKLIHNKSLDELARMGSQE